MKHSSCLARVLTCFCCEVMYICTVPRGGSGVYFLAVILSELPITVALVCGLLMWVGGRIVLWVEVGGGWLFSCFD
jgi:hypothetical protein